MTSLLRTDPPPTKPQARSDLIVHELDGEALIFDAATSDTHRLNETARWLWQRCDGQHNARQIAAGMTDIYDVTLDEVLGHVERMFAEFHQRGLLVRG